MKKNVWGILDNDYVCMVYCYLYTEGVTIRLGKLLGIRANQMKDRKDIELSFNINRIYNAQNNFDIRNAHVQAYFEFLDVFIQAIETSTVSHKGIFAIHQEIVNSIQMECFVCCGTYNPRRQLA